ncbi:MAG: PBP1A family penicillin-binding protein [Clostridiaceae bacterium]|nr:PBP1A family penicillin-binding protein [Clostridiaceae bacterium]
MSEKKPNDKKYNRSSKKEKRNNRKKIFLIIISVILLVAIIGTGIVVGMVAGIIKDAEQIDASNIYDLLDESSFILDSEGQVIEKVQTDQYRAIRDYSQMPDHLINAFIAIEDERFWSHNGLDVKRIFGAAWTNLRTGSRQGASTITQQLAKNLYLTHDQTYTRKIQDMYYAVQLEKQLSKDQILEAYLNTIYLGSGAYGAQAASQVYFSKDVGDLTIAEAALIAGIARNPRRYQPIISIEKHQVDEDRHYVLDDSDAILTIVYNDQFQSRQNLVLRNMKNLGFITEEEYNNALEENIKENLKPNRMVADNLSSYFGDLVREDVVNALINEKGFSRDEATTMLFTGGLRIYSTMDVGIQRILDEEFSKPSNFTDQHGNPLLEVGEDGNYQPQSAMVIMDHSTGEIKGIVGGRGINGRRVYNRALHPRQPGSSIKPLAVYTAAIDQGMTAATVFDDIPVYFDRGDSSRRYPLNFNRSYNGLMTMREAIEQSNNVAAVVAINQLGNNNDSTAFNIMFDYMERMGISTIVRPENPYITPSGRRLMDSTYSTALGGMTHGVSPLEMTAAYSVLANEGVYIDPITFTEIRDRHGNLILENKAAQQRVVSPEAAFIMTDMLRTSVTSGTGRRARIDQYNSQIPVAGKTGTTNSQKDAWFTGYTPYYVAATWIGFDTPDTLPQGSGMSASLWKNVMERVHQNYSPKNFDMPNNIVRANICTKSGKLLTEYCTQDPRGNTAKTELFIRGTQPTEYCDVHVKADIHAPTGKLATEHTPPWEIESRIFIKRPVPYNPADHGGIVPRDYQYELPTKHYDPLEDGMGFPPFLNGSPNGSIDEDMLNDLLDQGYDAEYFDDYMDDMENPQDIIDSVEND